MKSAHPFTALCIVALVASGQTAEPRRALQFDMGTATSVVRPGWKQVTHQTVYSPALGFGWEQPAEASFDDPVGVKEAFKPTHPHWTGPIHNDVLRDGVEDAGPLTFLAHVPPGRYWVSVTVGRYTKARHDLNIRCNGVSLATNVDAWDHVWGSHGGVPTRTVAAVVDGKLESLNADLRKIITALSANIEMSTSEVLFTDRVSLPGNEVLFEMMTGSIGVAIYWPMHAVTWEKTGGDVAVLVEQASSTELHVQLHSFAATPLDIVARIWRLAPGQYSQQLLHGNAILTDTKLSVTERGQSLAFTLPPRQAVRLRLHQLSAAPASAVHRFDLALGPDAIAVDGPIIANRPTKLRLTVHNIGSAAAPATEGELFAATDRVATVTWPALEAPVDFQPRRAVVEVTWTPTQSGPQELTLVLREKDGIFSGNNRWRFTANVVNP